MTLPYGEPPKLANQSCLDEKLDLFSNFESTYIIEQEFDTLVFPTTPVLPKDRQISFFINGSSYWLDLQHLLIEWDLQILNSDNSVVATGRVAKARVPAAAAVTADDGTRAEVPAVAAYGGCAFENNIAHTLIKNCSFRLNGVQTACSNNLYAESAWINTVLGYSAETRNTRLECQGYVGERDLLSTDVSGVDGHATRMLKTNNGKHLYVATTLNTPLCAQKRLIAPLVSVQIDLQLNSDSFCLRTSEANPSFYYAIQKVNLVCRKIKTTDSFTANFEPV